jgi:hypothetical protein
MSQFIWTASTDIFNDDDYDDSLRAFGIKIKAHF